MARQPKARPEPKLALPPDIAATCEAAKLSWNWKRHLLPLAVLWIATLAVYSNSFAGGPVYDNNRALLQDPRIRAATADNLHQIWSDDYWYKNSAGGLFRPLTTMSYLLNYSVLGNGTRTPGYHALNMLLQMVTVWLVYCLALLIFQEAVPAFVMAAIWALHPTLTESVTNIVGRADILAGAGIIGALLCYVEATARVSPRRWLWFAATAFATVIGMFSKESAIVILAIVPLYEICFGGGREWRWRATGYAAIAAPIALYLQMRSEVLGKLQLMLTTYTDNPLVAADFPTRILTAIKVIGSYLRLLVWPAGLSSDYSYNQIPLFGWRLDRIEDWKAICALVICLALATIAVYSYRRARPVFFFIALFFVALAPTANIAMVIGSPMAERFLYVPAIGFAGLVAWAGWTGYRRLAADNPSMRIAGPVVFAILCLGLGARTFARNFDWHDELSLWSSAVKVSPESFRSRENYALALIGQGPKAYDQAIAEAEKAAAIMDGLPDDQKIPSVWTTIGLAYRVRGDEYARHAGSGYSAQTNPWYQKALQAYLRGQAIDRIWSQEIKRENLAKGKIISNTGWPPIYLGLGYLYKALGEPQKALDSFRFGSTLIPKPDFFQEMSLIYRSQGDNRRAAIALIEGLTMDPSLTQLAADLVRLYRETAPDSCAVVGNSLNLACPMVNEQLCTASRDLVQLQLQMGQRNKAVSTAQGAVRNLGCPVEMFR